MTTKAQLFFSGTDVPGREQTVLSPAGCGPDVARVSEIGWQGKITVNVFVILDVEDPRLALLQKLLLSYKVDWQERRWDEYTDEEYEAARLILVTETIDVFVAGGPRFGTDYDLSSACPACGAGMRQTSAYVLAGIYPELIGRLEEYRAVDSYSEILVAERLADILEGAGISGLSFRSVYSLQKDNRQIKLPWRQMWASHTLPPMSPRSTGIESDEVCKSCQRGKYHTTSKQPTRIAYRAQDLAAAQDVNRMWEHFGDVRWNGDLKTAVIGQPYFLVIPKVWRIFKDAGVTGFNWLPIRVVEEEGRDSPDAPPLP